MSGELALARGRWSGWRLVVPDCGCAEEADGGVMETRREKRAPEGRQTTGAWPFRGPQHGLQVSIHRAYQVLLAGILATGADPSPA